RPVEAGDEVDPQPARVAVRDVVEGGEGVAVQRRAAGGEPPQGRRWAHGRTVREPGDRLPRRRRGARPPAAGGWLAYRPVAGWLSYRPVAGVLAYGPVAGCWRTSGRRVAGSPAAAGRPRVPVSCRVAR